MQPANHHAGRIGFRPMMRDDLPMVAGRLRTPEVAAWWGEADEFAHMPLGARAIDGFIGRPDLTGRGLGARFLRQRGDRLLAAGAPALVIDPDPSNERAVRAYRRAGFAGNRVTPGWDGEPVLILESWPPDRAEDMI